MQHLRDQLGDLLPDIESNQREQLLPMLAQIKLSDTQQDASEEHLGSSPERQEPLAKTAQPDVPGTAPPVFESILPPKTTDLQKIFRDGNLNQLQPRLAQGIYTQYYPPEILLRLLWDVSVAPVTLTGDRQVLSVGRKQRQFPEAIRRAILARDRGCAVPGCHWPAAWCEIHHIRFWSSNGETSVDNDILLCAHHHQSLHAKNLDMHRVGDHWQFLQHPLIDRAPQPRRNYFWQN